MSRREVVRVLAAARRARGLGQRQLSILLGFSPSCVGRWETARFGPSAETAMRWMNFLRVPVPDDVDVLFLPARPECGTRRGYQRHRKRGERCQECWAGYATYMRDWRAGRAA